MILKKKIKMDKKMLKNSVNREKSQFKDTGDYIIDTRQLELENVFKEDGEQLTIVENMNYIGQVDIQGIFQYISPFLEDSLGYKASDLIGKSIFDFFELMHPDDVDQTKSAFFKCITSSSPEKIQTRFKHVDGDYVWLESIGTPVLNEQDQVMGVVFSSHDITEQKIMEKKLLIRQEHFKSIFYHSPIATSIISMNQRFITVNQQFLNLTGYSQKDLKSLTIFDIVHPEDVEGNKDKMQSLINGEISQHQTEKRYIKKNGEIVWVSLSVNLIRDEQGEPIHFISMIEDITERKQAQDEINASLEEITILLGEIHQRVFNNLQLILKLINVQPLNVKGNSIEINKTSQNRVNAIALIHEKLSKSQDFAIIDFADYIISLKTHLFQSYNAKIDLIGFEVKTGNPLLDVDSAIPCALILNELITNSINHAFPEDMNGKITIEYISNDGKINLSVTDNGVGIKNPEIKNSGLKLVDMLVKQLNGSIMQDNKLGTRFRIEFPESKY